MLEPKHVLLLNKFITKRLHIMAHRPGPVVLPVVSHVTPFGPK